LRTEAQNLGPWKLAYICREDAPGCGGSGVPPRATKPLKDQILWWRPVCAQREEPRAGFSGTGGKEFVLSANPVQLLTVMARTTCVQSPRVPVLVKSVAKNSKNQMC